MRWPSSFRTASGGCMRTAKSFLLHHDVQRGLCDAAMPEGEASRRHSARHLPVQGSGKGRPRRNCLAAGRSSTRLCGAADPRREVRVAADVWSVTSYNELRREAWSTERWNRLHRAKRSGALRRRARRAGPDRCGDRLHEVVPDPLAPWLPGRLVSLGTDGFGRRENREHLRRHFEVDAASIVAATLSKLAREGVEEPKIAEKAFEELGLEIEGPGAFRA